MDFRSVGNMAGCPHMRWEMRPHYPCWALYTSDDKYWTSESDKMRVDIVKTILQTRLKCCSMLVTQLTYHDSHVPSLIPRFSLMKTICIGMFCTVLSTWHWLSCGPEFKMFRRHVVTLVTGCHTTQKMQYWSNWMYCTVLSTGNSWL